MKKPKHKTTKVLAETIRVEQFHPMVPRPLACDFGLVSPRTLIRAEQRGELHPYKRSSQAVSYRKSEILAFFGIVDQKPAPRRRHATAATK